MTLKYAALRRRRRVLAVLLLVSIFPASLFYLSTGIFDISFSDILRILISRLPVLRSIISLRGIGDTAVTVVELIRLPRLAAGIFVGAGLALSGAAYQGLFRNQLADPYTTGISAGATFGATLAVILGFGGGAAGAGGIALFAFLGALSTSVLVFSLTGLVRRVSSVTILLVGISINLFLSGIVALLLFLNRDKIETIVLWTMGSVSSVTWEKLMYTAPLFFIGAAGLFFCARPLDYLVLGGDIAKVHGVPVRRYTYLIIAFSSLITSACVSLSGIIGFVGLITPNVARLLFGFKHRTLFVFSLLFGIIFFHFADFLARVILAPAEIPVGILTSIIGVPFFLFLVFKKASGPR
jgi:iron complex transport system permease protein